MHQVDSKELPRRRLCPLYSLKNETPHRLLSRWRIPVETSQRLISVIPLTLSLFVSLQMSGEWRVRITTEEKRDSGTLDEEIQGVGLRVTGSDRYSVAQKEPERNQYTCWIEMDQDLYYCRKLVCSQWQADGEQWAGVLVVKIRICWAIPYNVDKGRHAAVSYCGGF